MHISRENREGFTLIEVTITMLVMGIFAAVAAPSYFGALANYQAAMAAKRVVADFQYAKSEAQRSSQARTVQFDTAADSYTLVGIADIDASANAYVVQLSEDPFAATLVSASFGADANVVFDMYGVPDSNGAVVVQCGSVQKTINLASDGTVTVSP